MKKLTLFYLKDCPYCHNARRALRELEEENPAYASAPVEWIEESERPDCAARYDYYYVPSVFLGQDKLYEATPGERYEDCKAHMRAALDAALA